MHSNRNIESNYVAMLYRERSYRMHIKKMNDIFLGKTLKSEYGLNDSKEQQTLLLNNRWKARQRSEGARLFEIQKKNDVLLERLVKISTREPELVPDTSRLNDSKINRSHSTSLFEKGRLTTLNSVERRLVAEKIAVENVSLAERIKLKKSDLSKAKLEADYNKHRERIDRIRKVSVKPFGTQSQIIKKGELEFRNDGRIVTKSRILPPLPKILFHKKHSIQEQHSMSASHRGDPVTEKTRFGRKAASIELSHDQEDEFDHSRQQLNQSAVGLNIGQNEFDGNNKSILVSKENSPVQDNEKAASETKEINN